jgi:D-3-phosphoglycerate dehydrogenase
MKVAITTTSFGKYDRSPLNRLKENQIHYILNPFGRKLNEEEVVELAKDAKGVIAGTEPLTAWVLNSLPSLRIISRCGSGMDNVDIEAAQRLRIKVLNIPFGPTLAVAELTVGLILGLVRRLSQMDKELKGGTWKKRMGHLLHGKRVGIIGFGRIGQKVAELLLPFGVEIGFCDINKPSYDLSLVSFDLEDLLPWADIISLHLSLPEEEEPVIQNREIRMMKKGAWLINTSRGGIVDEEALIGALKSGHLSGAALDVYEKEPYEGPLCGLDNVILTPHIGSYALEARVAMEMQAVDNLMEGLDLRGEKEKSL